MAQEPIYVVVLEGAYARLKAAGLPLPVCMQLQDLGVRLSDARWTARQSDGGFSVSLFWSSPCCPPIYPVGDVLKPTKRRRRSKRPNNNTKPGVDSGVVVRMSERAEVAESPEPVAAEVPAQSPPEHQPAPIQGLDSSPLSTSDVQSSQYATDNSNLSDLNLSTCEAVRHEVRDVPGIVYVKDGEKRWTPIGRPRLSEDKATDIKLSSSECDGETLHFPGREVQYNPKCGHPGLLIVNPRGSNLWTPIAARTRKKTSIKY